jgi:RNA polymerase primary sigma factor
MERSLECYLRDIGRYPLLSKHDEIQLAERVRQGDEEALHQLVRANLRFVVTVAKQYLGQGLSLPDLINEGNIGLLKAARRFDERRGFKFISYAVWWVRQSILQALSDQSRVVRLPQNRAVVLHRVNRAQAELQQRLGRSPNCREIAEWTEIRLEEVEEALHIGLPDVCLDQTVSDSDSRSVGETIPDDGAAPDEPLFDRSRREDLERCLGRLPGREAEILRLYFGLGDTQPLTLEEIGQRLDLTRERIRQLKERALSRLREGESIGLLRLHYEEV